MNKQNEQNQPTLHKRLSYFELSPLGNIREAAGYSQSQVAKLLTHGVVDEEGAVITPSPMSDYEARGGGAGCSRSAYAGMERGRFKIDGTGYTPDIRQFLAELFGVSVEEVERAWQEGHRVTTQKIESGEVKE